MQFTIRENEGCQPQPFLLWDSVWNAGAGQADWALAGADPLNAGGLQAAAALETAVILCLFTDARCPGNHPLAKWAGGDLRGWWGDGLGDAPLGSLLWLLERAAMVNGIERWAETLSADALQTLVTQGAVAKVVTSATKLAAGNGLYLDIALYAKDGTVSYAKKFELLWQQMGLN